MAEPTLTPTTYRLYCRTIRATIGLTATLALSMHLVFNPAYFPPTWQSLQRSLMTFWLALVLIVFCSGIIVIDNLAKAKNLSIFEMGYLLLERFTSFMGTLFSSVLVPAIIFIIGIVVEIILHHPSVPPLSIIPWRLFVGLIIIASVTSKFFSLLLVFTERLDTNTALEKSQILVKNNFGKTYFVILIGLLYFGLLATLTQWFPRLFPALTGIPAEGFALISQLLFALTGSWPLVLWLSHLYTLQKRATTPTT